MHKYGVMILAAVMALSVGAEEPAVEGVKPATFVVLLPERIDHAWYWLLYSDQSQHIVQSAIEKALVRAGLDVVDVGGADLPPFGGDWQRMQSSAYAVTAGRKLGADYVITGQATAVKSSQSEAYGVTVVRAQAEITAKLIRVSDGRVIDVEDAGALEGGQSAQGAGQAALKKAGEQIAAKLARKAAELAAP